MLTRSIRCLFVVLTCTLAFGKIVAQADSDGGVTVTNDGGGETVLQSIAVSSVPNEPFSLTLAAEWARSMTNGGTFTTFNSRPIKRDSQGRIYQERWLMAPKGSKIKPRMSWIQITDPVAHTYLECNARLHTCDLHAFIASTRRSQPSVFRSGPVGNGTGFRTHEDLGTEDYLGVPVHHYRDTTTLEAGAMGNDRPMVTLREFSYAASLNINLKSVVDAPSIGRQTFTVTEITLSEPEPRWFQVPEGYTVHDLRESEPPTVE